MTTKPMKMTTEAFAQFIARFGDEPGSSAQMGLLVRVLNSAAHSGIVDLVPTNKPEQGDRERAAAPDMLEACRTMKQWSDEAGGEWPVHKGEPTLREAWGAILAAIARAEGGAL